MTVKKAGVHTYHLDQSSQVVLVLGKLSLDLHVRLSKCVWEQGLHKHTQSGTLVRQIYLNLSGSEGSAYLRL